MNTKTQSHSITPKAMAQLLLSFTRGRTEDAAGRTTLARTRAFLKTYFRTHVPRIVVFAILGFVFGFIFNFVIMAFQYDGFRVPRGSVAAGRGNLIIGTIYWFFVSTVLFAAIGYRMKVGGKRFWADVRNVPKRVRNFVNTDSEAALVHVLWGLAGATLVMILVGPSLVGAISIGLVLWLGTAFQRLAMGLLNFGWRFVVGRLAPDRSRPLSASAAAVTALGGALAMIAGYGVPSRNLRFLLAIGAGVAAFLLGKRRMSGATALWFFVIAAAALLMDPAFAWADDGGVTECAGQAYLTCDGSGTLIGIAAIGGAAGGAGAALGGPTGEGVGGEGGPRGPGEEEPPVEGGGEPP